jgi:hypothetical protein
MHGPGHAGFNAWGVLAVAALKRERDIPGFLHLDAGGEVLLFLPECFDDMFGFRVLDLAVNLTEFASDTVFFSGHNLFHCVVLY